MAGAGGASAVAVATCVREGGVTDCGVTAFRDFDGVPRSPTARNVDTQRATTRTTTLCCAAYTWLPGMLPGKLPGKLPRELPPASCGQKVCRQIFLPNGVIYNMFLRVRKKSDVKRCCRQLAAGFRQDALSCRRQLAGASRQPAAMELQRLTNCRGGLPTP